MDTNETKTGNLILKEFTGWVLHKYTQENKIHGTYVRTRCATMFTNIDYTNANFVILGNGERPEVDDYKVCPFCFPDGI